MPIRLSVEHYIVIKYCYACILHIGDCDITIIVIHHNCDLNLMIVVIHKIYILILKNVTLHHSYTHFITLRACIRKTCQVVKCNCNNRINLKIKKMLLRCTNYKGSFSNILIHTNQNCCFDILNL